MKVAFNGLIIDEEKTGIGHYGYNLINNLIRIGEVEYDFFLQQCANVDCENAIYSRDYRKSYNRIIYEQLALPIKCRKADLIHYIDYSSSIINFGVPYIITIHDLSFYKAPETFSRGSRILKSFLTPIGIKRAARIIADSENTKNDIIQIFPMAKDKINVIYPGKPDLKKVEDKTKIKNTKEKYGISNNYILSVGTIEPRKNYLRLIKAFELIAREIKDIELVIVGRKGWLYEEVFEMLNKSIVREKVKFIGYANQDDMAEIYSGAEVFVYPSIYEGFGLPPLEAMCCGTPVVVANTSSLPEVVGTSGIYVNPYSEQSIAEGLIKVLNNSKLKETLVTSGYVQTEKFDWNEAALKVINLYKEILK